MQSKGIYNEAYNIVGILACLLCNSTVAADFSAEAQWQTIEATVGVRHTRGGYAYRATGTVVRFHESGFDVLTANHVIDGASGLYVEMFTRQSHPSPSWNMYEVRVQSVLPQHDLALLRVFAVQCAPRALQLATAEPRQGEALLTVGCGNQYAPYAAPGVYLHNSGQQYASSCPTIGGFSGGPVVNQSGELVALNVAIDNQGKAFSVSLPVIRDFLNPPVAHKNPPVAHVQPSPEQADSRMPILLGFLLCVGITGIFVFAFLK